MEIESAAYGACAFRLNDLFVRFRTSKITPTKTGQFVTLWKRNGKGPITQAWQLDYFLDTSSPAAIDFTRAKSLYLAV